MNLDKIYDFTQQASIKNFYLRIFDIRKGELKRVVLMQVTIFLLISTVLVIKPTINSLFLSDVGIRKLPHAFILVALTAGIITSFYSRLLNRIPLNRIIQFTLLFSVLAISSFSVLLKLNLIDRWVLYIFYAWVSIFAVLATSQFWILANLIFNAREAKRLFSLIGGAAIGGGIFGGYLTSLLAPTIGSENLLFIGVFFLVICIPLTRMIWNSNEEMSRSVFKRKQRMGKVPERPYRLILNSKHLTYLAMITAISVLVAKLVDYQFSAISSQRLTNEDELTAFFGFWFSNFNIISLLIQLFITRRVVGVYGVGVSLFFLPVGILIGALAIFISPGLWSAILIKASDGSLKQSVNKSAVELLALPIPGETKKQAKTFIDVFVDSFATGLSGILLITFINGFNIPVRFVSVLIIVLLIIWIRFIIKVRAEYISQFKSKLHLPDSPVKERGKLLDLSNESIYSGLIKVLGHGSDKQILYVLRNSEDANERLFESIRKLLDHPNPEVQIEAIRKIYFYKTSNLSDQVRGFLDSPNDELKTAALEYIIEHANEQRLETIQNYLKSEDSKIRMSALVAFANETRDNKELREQAGFPEWVHEIVSNLNKSSHQDDNQYITIQILRVIGTANLSTYYHVIDSSLGAENEKIGQAAIRAAGLSLDERFIPELLNRISNEILKEEAVKALALYGFRAIDLFRKMVTENKLSPETIYNLPLVIEKIGTQYGVDYLFELLDYKDIVVRNQALSALSRLKQNHPHLVFYNKRIIQNIYEEARLFMNTLTALYVQQEQLNNQADRNELVHDANKSLIDLLERRLDDNLQRIFKFLGLKYPPDEINSIYRELKSDKTEMRINAIEFLDNLLETHLKKVLIPIIETSLTETITKEVLKDLKIKIVGQEECFSMLLEGRDLKVKLAVLYLLSVLKDRRFLPLISNYVNYADKKISSFALKAVRAMTEGAD